MNKYEKMLTNASTIQYYKSILDNDGDGYITVRGREYAVDYD